MILKRLREETRDLHEALERRLPLLDAQLSREAYQAILERFYGYYIPLESQLSGLRLPATIGFDFEERRKVPLLEKDLLALRKTADELKAIPRCGELPAMDLIPQVLGCLYVIEGATLGGQIITRHLQARLALTPETGGAFFAGYQAETGARWQAFGVMIRAMTERFGGGDEIVASANRTFETLGWWLFPE